MKTKLLFATCFLSLGLLKSQNLVTNGNFETMSFCPYDYSQVTACASWYPAPNNTVAPYGTEYMNACNTGNFNVPSGTWGYQAAHSGNGYMALCPMAPTVTTNYRENIYTQLSSPLVVGSTYSVSMYVSHTDNSQNATNNIGFRFSKVPSFPINNISQVFSSSVITDNNNWVLISGTFVADSAYQYIAVGNFFTDANTTTTVSCSGCSFNLCGYFIDDVSVIERQGQGTGIERNSADNSISIYPNPSSGLITINMTNVAANAILYVTDIIGQEVLKTTLKDVTTNLDLSALQKGIYMLSITNGQQKHIRKIIIQ